MVRMFLTTRRLIKTFHNAVLQQRSVVSMRLMRGTNDKKDGKMRCDSLRLQTSNGPDYSDLSFYYLLSFQHLFNTLLGVSVKLNNISNIDREVN